MTVKNIAIIGYGGMGGYHAGFIAEKSDCMKIAGVYDIDENRMREAGKKGLKVYSSLELLLSDTQIDVVLIATPNDSHKEIAIKAMKAGKHVICEKPVALDSDELEEMLCAARENNRIFTVHQNRRWDEDYRTVKRIYDEDILGGIYRIESRVHGSRGIPGDWRGMRKHGGGMVLDWGVHILDQMLQLVPGKIKTVNCRLDHITNHEVDDGFTIELIFENGTTALLEVGTHHFIELPRWYMVGRDGTMKIDSFSGEGKMVKVRSWEDKDVKPIRTGAGFTKTMAPRTAETVEELELTVERPDVSEFYQNVCDAIDGKSELVIKHDQLMRVMMLMEAAFQSDATRQTVAFEE